MTIRIVLAGEGAIGVKHLEVLRRIDGVEVVSLAGGVLETTREVARTFGIPHWSLDLSESLNRPGVQGVILARELKLLQLAVQTYFFRRSNTNALGQPRSWTDHLLWHHAAHTVDLFLYQTGEVAPELFALEGPHHPQLGIAMDLAIGMKALSGALCSLSLSFNNDGPLGTSLRYICDNGTYMAHSDALTCLSHAWTAGAAPGHASALIWR